MADFKEISPNASAGAPRSTGRARTRSGAEPDAGPASSSALARGTPEASGGEQLFMNLGTRWLLTYPMAFAIVLAVGTGRTLKAAVDQLPLLECPDHRIVSLTGNITPDGSAAYYNVIFTISDTIQIRSFPMPLPVIASSASEREMLHAQAMIRPTLTLAAKADVTFVGIGDLTDDAPLYVDGFISLDELKALQSWGAVGEIVGWSFDSEGRLLPDLTNERVASAAIPSRDNCMVIAAAKGPKKLPGIRGALKGRLINGLITDEDTAERLLA